MKRALTLPLSGRTRKTIRTSKPAGWAQRPIDHAAEVIHRVCRLAGPADFVADIRKSSEGRRLRSAIVAHDTASLFGWFLESLSYQGVSNGVARSYMEKHGSVTSSEIEDSLNNRAICPKLRSYWRFSDCGYEKTGRTCKEPEHLDCCSLPTHDLRNGRLNQTAYSLYLFIRDIADGDLVTWIDDLLNIPNVSPVEAGDALIAALRGIYGVSDKVLTMTLSILLIAAPRKHRRWFQVGTNMIAIDTLVHNFLSRTGILRRLSVEHPYGPACYQQGHCADVVHGVANRVDARQFNSGFPASFPRFVQYAIWRYCSQQELNVCNGNRIDDRRQCSNIYCPIYGHCDRRALYS
jgi:hypothetical protein